MERKLAGVCGGRAPRFAEPLPGFAHAQVLVAGRHSQSALALELPDRLAPLVLRHGEIAEAQVRAGDARLHGERALEPHPSAVAVAVHEVEARERQVRLRVERRSGRAARQLHA